jgi:hypothetical protein
MELLKKQEYLNVKNFFFYGKNRGGYKKIYSKETCKT